jgi:hypothetical protein
MTDRPSTKRRVLRAFAPLAALALGACAVSLSAPDPRPATAAVEQELPPDCGCRKRPAPLKSLGIEPLTPAD